MAGFQKYPIPQWLNSNAWVVNRYWKRHFAHYFIPMTMVVYMMYRHFSITSVNI